jgi:heme A synthase
MAQDPVMNGTRRAGLIVAAVATALWVGALLGFATTGPEDGVNIGAALLAFVAVPTSIGALITLLTSLRDRRSGTPGIRWSAVILAILSMLALVTSLVLDPYDTPVTVQLGFLAFGVVTFLGSSALFAVMTRRPHRLLGDRTA